MTSLAPSDRAGLFLDAVCRMRARQIIARSRRLVPPSVLDLGLADHRHDTWVPLAEGLGTDRSPQSGHRPPPHETGVFDAVGVRIPFAASKDFWLGGGASPLFAFHVQGFADLANYAAGQRSEEGDRFWSGVVASWLESCRQPGRLAWHPFPTSRRIVSWSAMLSADGLLPDALGDSARSSLFHQARYLARCIEHDIGGNHVLHNGVALVFAGVCLGSAPLERRAVRLLRRELDRQLLADGGHEERSPAYHRVVMEALEDAATLLARAGRPAGWLEEAVGRMTWFLQRIAGPDGTLPLLNDAWVTPALPASEEPAARDFLSDSGYVVLRHGNSQAVLDVGQLAPAHLPAHAHADALSFVLWWEGRPLVIDRGTFGYSGPRRWAYRSTAAHNTVVVDGLDQCVFWGAFRASRLPALQVSPPEATGNAAVVVRASHDGYGRIHGDPVTHERLWCWISGDGLVVVDHLLSQRAHDVASRLHLAPAVRLVDGCAGGLRITLIGPLPPATEEQSSYSPWFGVEEDITVITASGIVDPGVPFGWALLRDGSAAAVEAGQLVITRPGGEATRIALRA